MVHMILPLSYELLHVTWQFPSRTQMIGFANFYVESLLIIIWLKCLLYLITRMPTDIVLKDD